MVPEFQGSKVPKFHGFWFEVPKFLNLNPGTLELWNPGTVYYSKNARAG